MNNVIGMVERAMRVDTDLTNIVANNIANSQTPGYLRKIGIVNRQTINEPFTIASDDSLVSEATLTIAEDTALGTVSQTGEPLDIALNGSGWLLCQTESGDRRIRGGRFHVDDSGIMVTSRGEPVLGNEGPIQFSSAAINLASIEVKKNGEIFEAGQKIGTLQVAVDTNENVQNPMPPVLQGYLEASNVNAVNEIVNLMEIVRHFEANQHVIRSYDSMIHQAISDLGKI